MKEGFMGVGFQAVVVSSSPESVVLLFRVNNLACGHRQHNFQACCSENYCHSFPLLLKLVLPKCWIL